MAAECDPNYRHTDWSFYRFEPSTATAIIFVFDATLIWVVMAWMNWFHPTEIGLLLRNEHPITNGFELLPFRRPFQKIRF
ncbi:hypothetical protein ACJZ2D_013492 [Fusarium nematophilum]